MCVRAPGCVFFLGGVRGCGSGCGCGCGCVWGRQRERQHGCKLCGPARHTAEHPVPSLLLTFYLPIFPDARIHNCNSPPAITRSRLHLHVECGSTDRRCCPSPLLAVPRAWPGARTTATSLSWPSSATRPPSRCALAWPRPPVCDGSWLPLTPPPPPAQGPPCSGAVRPGTRLYSLGHEVRTGPRDGLGSVGDGHRVGMLYLGRAASGGLRDGLGQPGQWVPGRIPSGGKDLLWGQATRSPCKHNGDCVTGPHSTSLPALETRRPGAHCPAPVPAAAFIAERPPLPPANTHHTTEPQRRTL